MSKKILSPTQQAYFIERPMGLVSLKSSSDRAIAIEKFMAERKRQLTSVEETGKSPDDLDVSLLLNKEITMRHWQFLCLIYREIQKQDLSQPRYVSHTGEVFDDIEDYFRFYAPAESE